MEHSFARIVHPTEFSKGSEVAFWHALKVALCVRGQLSLLHVSTRKEHSEWSEFPKVRSMLERWGVLPSESHRADVAALGLDIRKIKIKGDTPVSAISRHLRGHPADLLVVAHHQREGLKKWLAQETARPLARDAQIPTLFIPMANPGFVDFDTGAVHLERILIPVKEMDGGALALSATHTLVQSLGVSQPQIHLLFAGKEADAPALNHPEGTWHFGDGEVVSKIAEAAQAIEADLVVMYTHGRDSLSDRFLGSVTERVVETVRCPVLSLPLELRREEKNEDDD